MKNFILPLYYNPVLPPCSRSAWFLTGLFFGSLLVLALGEPSLFYNFFMFLYKYFNLGIDLYKSETGNMIVEVTKFLYLNYLDYCSTKKLTAKIERGENMLPPFFIWIFQDYHEATTTFFEKLEPVMFNKIYNKISGKLLNYVCISIIF